MRSCRSLREVAFLAMSKPGRMYTRMLLSRTKCRQCSGMRRQAVSGRIAGFPDQAAAFLDALERVGMREGLRVATQHHVHVVEFAIDLDGVGRDRQIVIGGRAFLFRPVFGIGHNEELFLQPPVLVQFLVALLDEVAEFADNFPQVLARGDHAPAADRVESHRDGAFRQQRRAILADDRIRMVNAQGEIGLALGGAATVLAAGSGRGRIRRRRGRARDENRASRCRSWRGIAAAFPRA